MISLNKNFSLRSGRVLEVFTKTVKELEKINTEIAFEILLKEELIKKQQQEIEDLNSIKSTNENISMKIEAFLI